MIEKKGKKIGLCGARDNKGWKNYLAAVQASGGEPIRIVEDGEEAIVQDVDGVILLGGCDVNPRCYKEANTDSCEIDDYLDQLELKVIQQVLQYKKPILGICRGHQILNVYFGGSLIQNVEHWKDHIRNGEVDSAHPTNVERDSFLYEIYQKEMIRVNSAHHQAVKKLGTGLRVVQRSEDGTIEAVCHDTYPIYGVQWHPERMCLKNAREDTVDGKKVFEYFIGKC